VHPQIKQLVSNWIKKYSKTHHVVKGKIKFFRHCQSMPVDPDNPHSVFYIMPKIHKTPMAVCPASSHVLVPSFVALAHGVTTNFNKSRMSNNPFF
jgi:hypothetical protein